MNTKIIKLDINRRFYDKIVAKQDDTGSRFLLFQLLDGAVPFNLTDRSVRVYGVKPDGSVVFNDLTVTHSTTGFCLLELTNQMLAIAGTVKLELMITEGDKKLTSIPFEMEVIKKINSNAAVESSNEFGALLTALKEIDQWNREFADKSGKLEELYTPRLNELGSQLDKKANLEDINVLRPEWSSLWNEEDCSDAIEDCINRLNGGVIKFSNKTYNISRPIDVKGGIRLEGTGVNSTSTNGATIIKLKDNSNCSILRTPCAKNNDGDSSAIHYFEIDHIQFDGNGQKQNIDSIGIDLQGVYIMTKLSFVSILNNRGTALSLSYGCDLQIDHVWILGTVITQGDRYAFEFNQKRVESGQSGMLNINHFYVENTSNKIGGNPKINMADRGRAILLNKVYTCNINELHIEGTSIPITIGDNCFTILIRKLSFANCGNTNEKENTIILLTNNINHLKIDDLRLYNCLNSYTIKKKEGFVHNNFRDVPKAENLSYEVIGYNMQPKYQPSTVYTDNIGVNLIENTKPLIIPLQHNDKGIKIKHDTSTNPKIYVTTNVNRDDEKEMFYYNSYGNDSDSFGIEAPIILYEKGKSTAIPNGSICLKNAVPTTRINGVIQNLVSIRTYTGTPGGGGIIPQFIGQVFIDTTNNKVYIAKGIESTSDWILLN